VGTVIGISIGAALLFAVGAAAVCFVRHRSANEGQRTGGLNAPRTTLMCGILTFDNPHFVHFHFSQGRIVSQTAVERETLNSD
jgi:hypothetical protein